MLCIRCGGLLLQNRWDSKESVQERMPSTRCVNCGCIDDPVIRANRRQPARVRLTATRGRVEHAEFAVLSSMKPNVFPSLCSR
jgi:hypothetical protein